MNTEEKTTEAAKTPAEDKKPEATKPAAKASKKKPVPPATFTPVMNVPPKTGGGNAPAPKAPDFKTLKSVEECVEAYNEMVLTAVDLKIPKVTTVKGFVDVKTGVLACERLHSVITKAREPKSEVTKTTAKQEKTVMAKKATKKTAKKTSKKSKGTGVKRFRFEDKAKISWLGKENPFREGSGKHERVELLRKSNGKTVATYVAAGGKTGTLGRCVKLKLVSVA